MGTFHVTPHHDCFTSYTTKDFGHVNIGNQGGKKCCWHLINLFRA